MQYRCVEGRRYTMARYPSKCSSEQHACTTKVSAPGSGIHSCFILCVSTASAAPQDMMQVQNRPMHIFERACPARPPELIEAIHCYKFAYLTGAGLSMGVARTQETRLRKRMVCMLSLQHPQGVLRLKRASRAPAPHAGRQGSVACFLPCWCR